MFLLNHTNWSNIWSVLRLSVSPDAPPIDGFLKSIKSNLLMLCLSHVIAQSLSSAWHSASAMESISYIKVMSDDELETKIVNARNSSALTLTENFDIFSFSSTGSTTHTQAF